MERDSKKKKILVVDDSALMRRMLCDIINNDKRFEVADRAINGLEALELLKSHKYDAVVLDVIMPKMGGLELLRELRRLKIPAKIMMASTYTSEGSDVTLEALSLGAMDFIKKPDSVSDCCEEGFKERMLDILDAVAGGRMPSPDALADEAGTVKPGGRGREENAPVKGSLAGDKAVAIATSTGGPRSLQSVIPYLPADLDAPVLLVQHMPKGFTASLAERLNAMSAIRVKEAEEGEPLRKGTVYLSVGGLHMTVQMTAPGKYQIHYIDGPTREGVKPSANYMYESLADTDFKDIVCVVMTGMGADGTEGIRNLKKKKNIRVITQDQESSIVYGMPRSAVSAGLSDKEAPLGQIAQEIRQYIGVQNT